MAKANDLSKLRELTGHPPSVPQPPKKAQKDDKQHRQNENFMLKPAIDEILTISSLELDGLREFMNNFEDFVKQKQVANLSAGQVRTIYNIIYEVEDIKALHLKRPELAFVAAKQDSKEVKEVLFFFMDIIKQASEEKHVKNIKDFTASFLKYHKLYGKNKQ